MAFDKKTSVYSDRGTIGSPEELDTYGVWVKSEPQDLTAGLGEAVNFDAEAVPYETDFGTDFGDLGLSDADFAGLGDEVVSADDVDGSSFAAIPFNDSSFDDDMAAVGRGTTDDASSDFLLKMAGELSAIRSELNTLKREFADIRAESGKPESADGFFSEEDDEKIALTGDEMENFLASADFSQGESGPFDPQRDADEAALKELSEQNEISASDGSEEPQEDIEIDFDSLGMDLEDGLEVEKEPELQEATQEDFSALAEAPLPEETLDEAALQEAALQEADAPLDDDLDALAFNSLSFDSDGLKAPALEQEEAIQETETAGLPEAAAPGEEDFAEELVPLDSEEDKEIQSLRLEGATPHTPAPEDTGYLESDPFVLENTEEPAVEEPAAGETITEEVTAEEPVAEEPSLEELSLEEPVVEDPVLEESPIEESPIEEPAIEEPVVEELPAEEIITEEITTEETVTEEVSVEAPAEDAALADADFGDMNLDITMDDLSTDDFSDIPPLEEEPVEEAAAPEPVAEEAADIPPLEEEPVEEAAAPEPVEEAADIPPLEEEPVEEPAAAAEAVSEEDLTSAVTDEPDFSAGLVDPPPEEPVLDDMSFGDVSFDDVSFDMDDFGESIEIGDAGEPAAELAEEPAEITEEPVEELAEEPVVEEPVADLDIADEPAGGIVEEPVEELAEEPAADPVVDLGETDTSLDDGLVADSGAEPLAEPEAEPLAEAEPAAEEEQLAEAEPAAEPETLDLDSPDLAMDDFGISSDLNSGDFDMGNLGSDLVLDDVADAAPANDDTAIQAKAESKPASHDDDAVSMDQVIPEGFEVNAQEAAISSDDLEAAFTEDELSIASEETGLADLPVPAPQAGAGGDTGISPGLKSELKSVLSYMDHLLESLPEDKIEEFAKSEYFDSYKKIFKELGLV